MTVVSSGLPLLLDERFKVFPRFIPDATNSMAGVRKLCFETLPMQERLTSFLVNLRCGGYSEYGNEMTNSARLGQLIPADFLECLGGKICFRIRPARSQQQFHTSE